MKQGPGEESEPSWALRDVKEGTVSVRGGTRQTGHGTLQGCLPVIFIPIQDNF